MGILGGMMVAVGVVLGLFVLVLLFGMVLPKCHAVSRSLKLPAPSERIWQVICDFRSVPTWHPDVLKVERLPDRHAREVWRETYQGGVVRKLETTELLPPRRLIRSLAHRNGPFTRCWEFEIISTDVGSRIAITEKGEVSNPLKRFLDRVFMNRAAHLEKYLKALAAKFGEAEVVKAEG